MKRTNGWALGLLIVGTACAGDVSTGKKTQTSGATCGGFAGVECAEGLYCHTELGVCSTADAQGTCEPTPEACPDIWAPVCGCDGTTYSNECDAAAAGQSVISLGECEGQPRACGGFVGLECGDGEFCRYEEDTCGIADELGTCAQSPEACIEIWDPVCGCDGKTYSTGCHAELEGVAIAFSGEC